MGLLIVDAVPAQDAEGVTLSPTQALVLVSVSRAESGQPVTGLNEGNFKVCWTGSGDVTVSGTFRELKLEPGDQSPAGVYLVTLTHEVPVQSGVNAAYGLLVQIDEGAVLPDGTVVGGAVVGGTATTMQSRGSCVVRLSSNGGSS